VQTDRSIAPRGETKEQARLYTCAFCQLPNNGAIHVKKAAEKKRQTDEKRLKVKNDFAVIVFLPARSFVLSASERQFASARAEFLSLQLFLLPKVGGVIVSLMSFLSLRPPPPLSPKHFLNYASRRKSSRPNKRKGANIKVK
jgi:hypothetical protein